ncbi:hypothetical protein ACHAW5_003143 [Stephanodiscus triporus]|uniref:PX domain-containing protein n=1 Tax=Stephanodiscus triporus TaxID=2934178 RepID=A0ABD3NWK8_9STRA
MRAILEQLAQSVQECAKHKSGMHDRRRGIQFVVLSLIPILASFVYVQMQQQQKYHSYYGFEFFGCLWRSTALGLATLTLSMWHFTLRVVGVSLGIGLGLGFAGHVYDALAGDVGIDIVRTTRRSPIPNLPKDSIKSAMEDINSYHFLMRSAGYSVNNGTLRAQMVRGSQASTAIRANNAKRELKWSQIILAQHPGSQLQPSSQHRRVSVYDFNKGKTASMRMKTMWPNLAPIVNESLAKLIEFVLRDYVSSWYSKVDEHVVYDDPDSSYATMNLGDTHILSRTIDGSEKTSNVPEESERTRKISTLSDFSSVRQDSPGSVNHYHSFSEVEDISLHQRPQTSKSLHSSSFSLRDHHRPIVMEPHPAVMQQQQRTMILTTTGTQTSPFIDSIYTCFAYFLGMLATRASENVNVLELLLLHFPNILGQNLRVYREMKNLALEKRRRRILAEREELRKTRIEENDERNSKTQSQFSHSSSLRSSGSLGASTSRQEGEVTEIAIVREYLLAGRFHRALTFGLDVPSLLFADPLAKDCPPGSSFQGNSDWDRLNGHPDEDAILFDRLLSPESSLIGECELDYSRVLAAKLIKMLVPKTEAESSIIRSMLVELLANCVLEPVMGCFHPDSVNGWIITGLGFLEDKSAEGAANSASTSNIPENTIRDSRIIINDLETKQSINNDPSKNFSTSVVSEGEDSSNIIDEVLEEIVSEGSVASSDLEESLFDMDAEGTKKKEVLKPGNSSKAEQIITLLSMSIIELGSFVDFCRAREHGQDNIIDWDSQKCQDSVRHLVLVIEAALLFGIRSYPRRQQSQFQIEATLDQPDEDEFEVDIDDGFVGTKVMSKVYHHHSSLSGALMELTGDIDAFELLVEDAEQGGDDDSLLHEHEVDIIIPKPNELSTLRTLIAAWLHTGQAYKVLSIVIRAKETILQRFYHKHAFLRRKNYAGDFTRLLRQLDGVNILVDTMAVLESQCLLVDNGFEDLMRDIQSRPKMHIDRKLDPFPEMIGRQRSPSNVNSHFNMHSMTMVGSVKANLAHNRNRIARFAQSATDIDLNPWKDRSIVPTRNLFGANIAYNLHQNNHSTPAYLVFSKNDVFASSLRSERERRYASWSKETKDKKNLDFVSRSNGVKDKDVMMHRELHNLSRFFYSNTYEVRIEPCFFGDDLSLSTSAANVTVKGVGTRRLIEVPDEDSSFLLRASPRPLKPVAIQRDQRNPALGCKVYLAMYEEPAIHPKTKRFYGGRYLRQCLMRYYPNDRTASVTVARKICVLDGRIQESDNDFVLTENFENLRHTCLKVAVGGILSSPIMEPGDFCSTPRTGRAVDFVHRISLFERPMVELGGKKFVVYDASSHHADASSLELSDASMTAALILRGSSGLNVCDVSPGSFTTKVTDDGMPLILLKAYREESSGSSPKAKGEARPCRPSFIRAALLVKSAKQEAQSQCLLNCIRSGSARSSTKFKSDEWLQPTLTLLEYASSRGHEGQSTLQRDLHFGINHIDRGQLIRNGILNPRYPTILRGLNTKVEGVVEVKSASDFDLLGSPLFLFRIRCTVIAEYVGEGDDDELGASRVDASPDEKKKSEGLKSRYFREEWTVLRSLRDFTIFHKHIKGQVSPIEHSASASAKLVGSVSAALTIVGGNTTANERQRGPLVPSLSQATKAGNLGVSTKRVMERRKKLLDQYLKYLISPNNLLSRCPELLTFLGAYTSISFLTVNDNVADEYGREDITRVELVTESLKAGVVQVKQGSETIASNPDVANRSDGGKATPKVSPSKAESSDDGLSISVLETTAVINEAAKPIEKKQNQPNHAAREMARIRAGEISLKDVRRAIFRLLKDLFDLDNASFFRSRIHVKYMNGEWLSGWILYFVNMFWPNDVFYKKAPLTNEEESINMKRDSKKMIEDLFPDQLRTVLGKHTDDGLEMLHEMLQNRLVLKSMAYMIIDLVWVELFPELNDFITGAECLGKDA